MLGCHFTGIVSAFDVWWDESFEIYAAQLPYSGRSAVMFAYLLHFKWKLFYFKMSGWLFLSVYWS
jgi:hypothetical protein